MTKTDQGVTAKFRALRERAGLSLASLAKGMGYKNSSSIQRYENPDLYTKDFLTADVAQKLVKALAGKGTPPITEAEVWELAYPKPALAHGGLISSYDPDKEPDNQSSENGFSRESWKPSVSGALPEVDVKLGAGNGQTGSIINLPVGQDSISGHKVVAEWIFPLSFLHNEMKANPSKAVVMEIVGDSMHPSFAPGDRVIVDLAQNTFSSDAVYAISDGYAEPQIKRLQRIPFSEPTQVRVISDNSMFETFTVELDQLSIIGRICGHFARK